MVYPLSNLNVVMIKSFLGIAGNIFDLSFFIAPVSIIKKLYYRQQKYEEIPYLLMLMTIFNCSLWLSYGLIINDSFLKIGNLIGAILNMIYLIIYFYYRWENNKTKFYLISFSVTFLFFSIWGIFTFFIKDANVSRFTAMIVTISVYGSPGQKIVAKFFIYFFLI